MPPNTREMNSATSSSPSKKSRVSAANPLAGGLASQRKQGVDKLAQSLGGKGGTLNQSLGGRGGPLNTSHGDSKRP